jgi:hypothetical protein
VKAAVLHRSDFVQQNVANTKTNSSSVTKKLLNIFFFFESIKAHPNWSKSKTTSFEETTIKIEQNHPITTFHISYKENTNQKGEKQNTNVVLLPLRAVS